MAKSLTHKAKRKIKIPGNKHHDGAQTFKLVDRYGDD